MAADSHKAAACPLAMDAIPCIRTPSIQLTRDIGARRTGLLGSRAQTMNGGRRRHWQPTSNEPLKLGATGQSPTKNENEPQGSWHLQEQRTAARSHRSRTHGRTGGRLETSEATQGHNRQDGPTETQASIHVPHINHHPVMQKTGNGEQPRQQQKGAKDKSMNQEENTHQILRP